MEPKCRDLLSSPTNDALPIMGTQMIRDIQASDMEAVTRIYNHYITHTTVSFEEAPVTARDMQARVDGVLASGFPWLVLEDGNGVAGYAYANVWNRRSAYRYTAEITVYLEPEATGRGGGTRLYGVLFDRLGKLGIRTVIGGIGLPNAASVALHEKMGLEKVAHFARVGYKFGQWLDVGYWQGGLGDMGDEDD